MAQQVASEPVVDPTEPELGRVEGRSPTQLVWARLRKDRYAIAGAAFIVVLTLLAVFAGFIAKYVVHHGPNEPFIFSGTAPDGIPYGPSSSFWFGHDTLGRDVFVRVLYGARTSLIVAVVATGIAMIIGVILGLMAGYYRGAVDTMVSRTIDVMMSLPILLLAIGLAAVCGSDRQGCLGGSMQWPSGPASTAMWFVALLLVILGAMQWSRGKAARGGFIIFLGLFAALLHFPVPLPSISPGLPLVIFIIAFVNWTYIARIIRGQVLSLREKEFVESSYATGASDWRIMLREIMPNLAMPIIVYSTLIIPTNILFEASLSFLGVGVSPETASWGRMISDASANGIYQFAPWLMIYPGLFLFLTTFAFNLIGDGLRDALDPRTAK
ncbi:MAG TPA: ABC transporter permease [Actinomycetota bacterium]|jgi:ABC-type dipeptide/oligopeptide/nickel transport system permease subunit